MKSSQKAAVTGLVGLAVALAGAGCAGSYGSRNGGYGRYAYSRGSHSRYGYGRTRYQRPRESNWTVSYGGPRMGVIYVTGETAKTLKRGTRRAARAHRPGLAVRVAV